MNVAHFIVAVESRLVNDMTLKTLKLTLHCVNGYPHEIELEPHYYRRHWDNFKVSGLIEEIFR